MENLTASQDILNSVFDINNRSLKTVLSSTIEQDQINDEFNKKDYLPMQYILNSVYDRENNCLKIDTFNSNDFNLETYLFDDTNISEGKLIIDRKSIPIAVIDNLGRQYVFSIDEVTYSGTSIIIDLNPIMIYRNISSITGQWKIVFASPNVQPMDYNPLYPIYPTINLTFIDSDGIRYARLDDEIEEIEFLDSVIDLKKVAISLKSANSDISGNIFLIPVINDVQQSGIIIPVNGDLNTYIYDISATGKISFLRDYNNELDTLKDGSVITAKIYRVLLFESTII